VGKDGLRGSRGDDLRGRYELRTPAHVFPQFYQVNSASKSWRQVAGRVTCDNVPETFLPRFVFGVYSHHKTFGGCAGSRVGGNRAQSRECMQRGLYVWIVCRAIPRVASCRYRWSSVRWPSDHPDCLTTACWPMSRYTSKNRPPTRAPGASASWGTLIRRAKRDPEANMLSLQSFLRKGLSLGYVGRIKT